MGAAERWLSLAAGGGLILAALRKDVPAIPAALVGAALVYRGAVNHCPLYEAMGIDRSSTPPEGPDAVAAVTINKSPEELYQFWRDLSNAPTFMKHIKEVRVIDEKTSEWKAELPGGVPMSWKAEIIEDLPNSGIRWRSTGANPVDMKGAVRFTPGPAGRGTRVIASMIFGSGGGLRAKLAGPFAKYETRKDLMRFKQLMETGEIATTEGQPSGRVDQEEASQSGAQALSPTDYVAVTSAQGGR